MAEKNVTDLKKMYTTVVAGDFPPKLQIELVKESDMRYGENPNQPGAVYRFGKSELAKLTDIRLVKSGKGGLSATNWLDVNRALEILKYFKKPSVAVMKHAVPSGFATQFGGNSLVDIYRKARDADARSAFGSVVVFNVMVDKETADEIMTTYVEAVVAPEFDDEALEILSEKKNMRLILFSNLDKVPKFAGDDTGEVFDMKVMGNGRVIVQVPYLSKIRSQEDLVLAPSITSKEGAEVKIKRKPTDSEMEDLFTGWYVNLGVRSNGVIIVKDGMTLSIGSGQQERVGAVEQAILKAYQKALDRENIEYDPLDVMASVKKLSKNPLKGAVLSSDGFFPFRDSIDLIAAQGISAIIQPGGSVRDFEVLEAANEHGIAMAFTTERAFGHF